MSTKQKRYRVEVPEEAKKVIGVSFRASPRTMEKAAAYARANEMTISETCCLALDQFVESNPVAGS